jgi:hypothetical protein
MLGSVLETVSRCLLSLTQALATYGTHPSTSDSGGLSPWL